MPNRRLTELELQWANGLLNEIAEKLKARSGGDDELLFALRRKIYKELTYQERGRPVDRAKLKLTTRALQGGLCAACKEPLAESYTVLDRFEAAKGYVAGNVRVLCEQCDRKIQKARRYNDNPTGLDQDDSREQEPDYD